MKKAHTILSHIRNLPEFKLLKSHYCYQKFISLLSPKFKKAIAFVYLRDDTLFVALSHPGFKMELNYNKDLLKSLLSMLAQSDEKCQNMKASKVVLFNSKHLSIVKEKEIESTIPYYAELAQGEFTIQTQDKELKDAFTKIKASIEKQQYD
jgi:endonuclease IV